MCVHQVRPSDDRDTTPLQTCLSPYPADRQTNNDENLALLSLSYTAQYTQYQRHLQLKVSQMGLAPTQHRPRSSSSHGIVLHQVS